MMTNYFDEYTSELTLATLFEEFSPELVKESIDKTGVQATAEEIAEEMAYDVADDCLACHPLDPQQPTRRAYKSCRMDFENEATPIIVDLLTDWSE